MERQRRTRREFLSWVGTGALATVGAVRGFGAEATAASGAKPATRARPPLGLASYSLRKFSLEDALAMTQRVGLTHICLKSFHLPLEAKPEEIAEAAAKVRTAGIKLYGGGVITMKTEEQVHQAFHYAKAAGMEVIVGVPHPDVLALVERKVKELDIRVAIHNHGPGDDLYPTPKAAYDRIRDLDPRIGLCMDVGHTFRIGDDPIRSAELYADRLLDLHIKDVTAAEPNAKEVEIGRGAIDIPELLKTIVRSGYSGVLSFEYEKDPDDPLAGLAESVGFVRGVLATI